MADPAQSLPSADFSGVFSILDILTPGPKEGIVLYRSQARLAKKDVTIFLRITGAVLVYSQWSWIQITAGRLSWEQGERVVTVSSAGCLLIGEELQAPKDVPTFIHCLADGIFQRQSEPTDSQGSVSTQAVAKVDAKIWCSLWITNSGVVEEKMGSIVEGHVATVGGVVLEIVEDGVLLEPYILDPMQPPVQAPTPQVRHQKTEKARKRSSSPDDFTAPGSVGGSATAFARGRKQGGLPSESTSAYASASHASTGKKHKPTPAPAGGSTGGDSVALFAPRSNAEDENVEAELNQLAKRIIQLEPRSYDRLMSKVQGARMFIYP